MKKLPVVFACDNNYAMPFAVTVESLLKNRKPDTFYQVYCLIPEDFAEDNMLRLNKLKEKYSNFELNFVDLGDEFNNIDMHIEHISYVTYFRLLLPELLKDSDVCLYLDVDMIICQDLTDLFATDLTGFYIGAVKHPLLTNRTEIGKHKIAEKAYFNAGMLLMNLDLMRKDNKQQEFIKLMDERLPIQDQDILNVACAGKIKYLPLKYNMMIKTLEYFEKSKSVSLYGEEFYNSKKSPSIIHYANKEKPWDYNNLFFSKQWDDVYNSSVYADIKLNQKKVSRVTKLKNESLNAVKKYLLKFSFIKKLNNLRKKLR